MTTVCPAGSAGQGRWSSKEPPSSRPVRARPRPAGKDRAWLPGLGSRPAPLGAGSRRAAQVTSAARPSQRFCSGGSRSRCGSRRCGPRARWLLSGPLASVRRPGGRGGLLVCQPGVPPATSPSTGGGHRSTTSCSPRCLLPLGSARWTCSTCRPGRTCVPARGRGGTAARRPCRRVRQVRTRWADQHRPVGGEPRGVPAGDRCHSPVRAHAGRQPGAHRPRRTGAARAVPDYPAPAHRIGKLYRPVANARRGSPS